MDAPKFQAQDRVRICKTGSKHDGKEAVILWTDQYGIGVGGEHEYTVAPIEGNEFPPGPSLFFLESQLEKIGTFDMSDYVGWEGGPA